MKTITVVDEVQMYIFMLEESRQKVYTSYLEIQKDLKEEFEVEISVSDIAKVYEPFVEEDALDLQIMMKNIYAH